MARKGGVTNPTVARCSACGSECKRYLPYWPLWRCVLAQLPWQAFAWLAVWRLRPSLTVGFSWVLVLALPYVWAERRVYHAWWAWRHPTRCGGGGEPQRAGVEAA